jgi:AP endonuclease-2
MEEHECPICGKTFHSKVIHTHVEACLRGEESTPPKPKPKMKEKKKIEKTEEKLRLVSWNVNGIKALLTRLNFRSISQLFEFFNYPEVLCLQETKLARAELTEDLACPSDYHAFYSHCECRKKGGGYSGVATFVRKHATPTDAFTSLSSEDALEKVYEKEGRCMITDHRLFVLLNCYFPACCGPKDSTLKEVKAAEEREEFKQRFQRGVQHKIAVLRCKGRHVILAGDINISHLSADVAWPERLQKDSPSRLWLTHMLNTTDESDASASTSTSGSLVDASSSGGLVDSFRRFHPHDSSCFTCWCMKTNARVNNYGSRIDYVLVDKPFADKYLQSAGIEAGVHGSDHAPVWAQFRSGSLPDCTDSGVSPPPLCAALLRQFAGRQQGLASFLRSSGGSSGSSSSRGSAASDGGSGGGGVKGASRVREAETCGGIGAVVVDTDSVSSGDADRSIELWQLNQMQRLQQQQQQQQRNQRKRRKPQQPTLAAFLKPATATANTVDRVKATVDTIDRGKSQTRGCGTAGDRCGGDNSNSYHIRSHVVSFPTAQAHTNGNASCSSGQGVVGSNGDGQGGEHATHHVQNTVQLGATASAAASFWKGALKGPPPAPLCEGHNLPCVLRTVLKQGPNFHRRFYVCQLGNGRKGQASARCEHFQWATTDGRPL